MARPVVALLTDFGTSDHYVGTMKGAVLSVCPDAALVDLTHDIPPQDLVAAGFQLAAAYRYFPPATVFLAVVDPGVGTERHGIAAEAGGYHFVAPDNGLLSLVFTQCPPSLVVRLQEPKYARSTISRTFEGRDRFAPAAGWIAGGTALGAFGPKATSYQTLRLPPVSVGSDSVSGEVIHVDRFGNLITNIDQTALQGLAAPQLQVSIGPNRIPHFVASYAEAPAGELCALSSSSGYLEIAVNAGSAAARLGVGRGATVIVQPRT